MTPEQQEASSGPSRRIVFQGLAALGVAAALAGCGSSDTDSTSTSAGDTQDSAGSESAAPESSAPASGSAEGLVATSEVPVGGGVILTDQKIIVTQPTEGTFEGYSTACPHQGLEITQIDGETITCTHHGSRFSASGGAVENGPATGPLTKVAVSVEGDQVILA